MNWRQFIVTAVRKRDNPRQRGRTVHIPVRQLGLATGKIVIVRKRQPGEYRRIPVRQV